jgi:DNA adenine methylase
MDLDSLRRQLGDAIWTTRLAEACEREVVVRKVLAAVDSGTTFVAAAREHAPEVCVQSVRRWVDRWRAEGVEGLLDRHAGVAKVSRAGSVAQLSLGDLLGTSVPPDSPGRRGGRGGKAGFVKWSGSKAAVVDQLLALAPPRFERYHEPFLGGGSLFFALRPKASFLSDRNAELINLYVVVRDQPEPLLEALALHENTRDHYHHVRGIHPDTLPSVERAARTLFLNRTCFNGMYRVNSKGIFNVPYGNMPHHGFYLPDAIWRAHRDLAGAQLACEDFELCAARAEPGDFVYLDPPYPSGLRGGPFDPVKYQTGGFSVDDHRRVAELVRRLARRGVLFMLSNSDCELTRELFSAFRIDTLSVRRRVGGHAERRGVAQEIIVRNYEGSRNALPLAGCTGSSP